MHAVNHYMHILVHLYINTAHIVVHPTKRIPAIHMMAFIIDCPLAQSHLFNKTVLFRQLNLQLCKKHNMRLSQFAEGYKILDIIFSVLHTTDGMDRLHLLILIYAHLQINGQSLQDYICH